jgi:hypothetical protein
MQAGLFVFKSGTESYLYDRCRIAHTRALDWLGHARGDAAIQSGKQKSRSSAAALSASTSLAN